MRVQGGRGMLCVLGALLLGALVGASPAAAANTINVADVQVTEAGATVTATFTLARDADIFAPAATVSYRTADGSAKAAADYAAADGTASFPSTLLNGGRQYHYVEVAIKGDAIDEPDETLRLVMSGPEVVDGDATATIRDDDPPPALDVSDGGAVPEGAAKASFVVQLPAASGREVTVVYATADQTATAGQDYTARSGSVALAPGQKQVMIDVALLDDGADEPAESFELRLSSPGFATLGDSIGVATITDDDEPAAVVQTPARVEPQPAAAGGAPQQPVAATVVPLPTLGSGAPASAGSKARPSLGVSSPRLRRPSTVLVTVSCPRASSRCAGRVTIFSIANTRSAVKALRRQRRLGQLTFSLAPGGSRTLAFGLGSTDRALLQRTGRMRVRAYAVTRDSAGRSGVRSVNGTLIARTAHSSLRRP